MYFRSFHWFKARAFGGLMLLVWALAACSSGAAVEQSGGAVGPQEIKGATEIVKFDPASIPVRDGAPSPGACRESSIVPGAYRCDLEGGGAAEPCFALGGTRLLCQPDPAGAVYGDLVAPTNTLPSLLPPSPDQATHFFVELDTGMTCAIRTGPEPVIVGGAAAQYDCDEPYTFIVDFDKSQPAWQATVYTLDPATGQSPSGEVALSVVRAWIP